VTLSVDATAGRETAYPVSDDLFDEFPANKLKNYVTSSRLLRSMVGKIPMNLGLFDS
jgi:hypothetical protein